MGCIKPRAYDNEDPTAMYFKSSEANIDYDYDAEYELDIGIVDQRPINMISLVIHSTTPTDPSPCSVQQSA